MRRFLLYFCGFVILFFIAPAICTVTSGKSQETIADDGGNEQEQMEDSGLQENSDSKTIKLLHSITGEVQELNLDEYLYGVVSSEILSKL